MRELTGEGGFANPRLELRPVEPPDNLNLEEVGGGTSVLDLGGTVVYKKYNTPISSTEEETLEEKL